MVYTKKEHVKGVKIFMYKNGVIEHNDQEDYILQYAKEKNFAAIEIVVACEEIQKNFPSFIKWFFANKRPETN